jgi:hypothetical protein
MTDLQLPFYFVVKSLAQTPNVSTGLVYSNLSDQELTEGRIRQLANPREVSTQNYVFRT